MRLVYNGLEAAACMTARRRLLLGLYDGSDEEAVAWLVRRLGGGCRLASTTAERRLSLGLYDGSEEADSIRILNSAKGIHIPWQNYVDEDTFILVSNKWVTLTRIPLF
jgi:hypothetical protein